jgi:hypothetical protein
MARFPIFVNMNVLFEVKSIHADKNIDSSIYALFCLLDQYTCILQCGIAGLALA